MDRSALAYLDTASPQFSTRSEAVFAAREAHWCARTPFGLAILRHREVGHLLRDRRLRQGSHAWPRHNDLRGSFADFWIRSVIGQEGPPHKALRRIANDALSTPFVTSLKPAFDDLARRQALAFDESGEIEFMEAFSTPFAGKAITTLLGLPEDRWPEIANDASDLGLAMGVECKRYEARVNAACDRLMGVAEELVARVRTGGDDASYVARLTHRFDAADEMSEQQLLDMVVISIFGGVDTTRSQLGLGMSLFHAHPEEYQRLRANPTLAPLAVEEFVRTMPTTTWVTREAIEDFEFEGVAFRAGETLHLLVHASSRDPRIGASTQFSIAEVGKKHFGFGGGAHHCLGFQVARSDMASALTAIAARVASFEIAGEAEFLPDSGNTGPVRLPLRYQLA